ncbi:MAG: hypothetical protein ACYDA6_01585 [Solirubrobacteraceae bacterium]
MTYRAAQRDFLKSHLARWVPEMVAAVVRLEPREPFAWGLGRLEELVRCDYAYVTKLLAA